MTKGSIHTSQSVPLLFQAVVSNDVEETSSISNDEEFGNDNSTNGKRAFGTTSYTTLSTVPLQNSFSSEEEDDDDNNEIEDGLVQEEEAVYANGPPSAAGVPMGGGGGTRHSQGPPPFTHPIYDHSMPPRMPTADSDFEDDDDEEGCIQVLDPTTTASSSRTRLYHSNSRRKNSHKSRRKRRQASSSTTKGGPSSSSDSKEPNSSSIKLIHIVKSLFVIWVFGMVGLVIMDSRQRPSTGIGPGSVVSPVRSTFKANGIPDTNTPLFPLMGRGHGVKHIPLPLPEHKVSVVLMNYSRPRMIRESSLMSTLLAHPNIDEVVLLHANPKAAFKFVHPKIVNIDAARENDEMGLSIRFYYCQLLKNKWVIHVDDDMEFSSKALSELLIEFSRNTKRIVGRFGRDLKPNRFNGYNSANTHGDTEVILTKFMVMERDMCSSFFEYSHLVWEDTVLNSGDGPLWNGEDIFMSLVANHVYGADDNNNNNYAMDWLDVWEAPESLKDYNDGKLDISGRLESSSYFNFHWWRALMKRDRHYSYRGSFWQKAKARLAET